MAQGKKYIANDEDRVRVSQMAAVGITYEQISLVIGISSDTLVKNYKIELETSKVKAITKIAGALYQKALKGDKTCMMFYLKTQAGWRETNTYELTGKDGADLVPTINISLKKPSG